MTQLTTLQITLRSLLQTVMMMTVLVKTIGSFSANVDNTSSVAWIRGSRDEEERSVAAAGHCIHPQEHHDDIGAGNWRVWASPGF